MNRLYLLFILSVFFISNSPDMLAQRANRTVEKRLNTFFNNYSTSMAEIGKSRLRTTRINTNKRTLEIYVSTNFGCQPFTPENVKAIYRSVKQILPGPYNYYKLTIYADDQPIEELIPNALRNVKEYDEKRTWKDIDYTHEPWVKNLSRPYTCPKGLTNEHISLWQSHGRFFKQDSCKWMWQRPRLFCTTEDLFTQTFVVPYLIPMLENAGAVVFTPRERDWQRNEVIVDSDISSQGSIYAEGQNPQNLWQTSPIKGFAHLKQQYSDGENPFIAGTARIARASNRNQEETLAQWTPNIPETGRYAVYVSYQTFPESIPDAHYLVYHKGGITTFSVNQQMGGSTWVYLGTFDFAQGVSDSCKVVLTTQSKQAGIVCADAVRFGGGMGNIARGTTPETETVSGMPRYLEGARYQAQWSGLPYEVYSPSKGENDYTDDINARSHIINYLSGGSIYNPDEKGLKVPLDLNIAIHSDAGIDEEDGFVGTLGIYTTNYNNGKLATGISRYASRDLTDMVLTGLQRDISATHNINWHRRQMWNRNYSETRLPAIPSMILETLSHQNFQDMKLGHDPHFKFTVARSVYKSILKYEAIMHGRTYTVQPLPIEHFAIRFRGEYGTVELSWTPTIDPLEPTAKAENYVVYTRIGDGGFDNGELVNTTSLTKQLEPGIIYSFKVTAVNKGGESFPSEILTAYQAVQSEGEILIVNGFDRLSAPAIVETLNLQGFNLREDPGVPYGYTPAYCGEQTYFHKDGLGKETENGLGYSNDTWEGQMIAGNTFDYPYLHGKAFHAANPNYSFVSCSDEAVESGKIKLNDYDIVDLILGVELQPFSENMKQSITNYCQKGGNLIVSGSHLDRTTDLDFTRQVLKYTPAGNQLYSAASEIMGTGINFHIYRKANEHSYAVPAPARIEAVAPAFAAFAYVDGDYRYSAGIAYKGDDYRTFILGFPLESITDEQSRSHILSGAFNLFNTQHK